MILTKVQQRCDSLCTAIRTCLLILLLWELSLAQVTTTITPDRTLATEMTQRGNIHAIAGGHTLVIIF